MTTLGKVLFSLLLVGAGFLLASVFGPPELADQLAEKLTPGEQAPAWDQLQPQSTSAAAMPSSEWAYFAQSQADRIDQGQGTLRRVDGQPDFPPVPAEPSWMTPASRSFAEGSPPTLNISEQLPRDQIANQFLAPALASAAPTSAEAPRRDAAVRPAAAEAWLTTDNQPTASSEPWPEVNVNLPAETQLAPAWPSSEPVAAAPAGAPPIGAWAASQPVATQPTMVPSPVSAPAPVTASRSAPAIGAWEQTVRSESAPSPAHNAAPSWPAAPVGWSASRPQAPAADSWPSSFEPEAVSAYPSVLETTGPRTHIVADGDTLARLAERYLGDASRAGQLYAMNRNVLVSPDLLPIGVELQVDAPLPTTTGVPQSMPVSPNQSGLAPVSQQRPWAAAAPQARLLAPQPAGYATMYPQQ